MLAVDTSTFVSYLKGDKGSDVEFLNQSLIDKNIFFPPIVITELLSSTKIYSQLKEDINSFPTLELSENYWTQVGYLRSQMSKHGYKAKLADSLIAQSCLDHQATLITRDKDFLTFQKIFDLKLHPCSMIYLNTTS